MISKLRVMISSRCNDIFPEDGGETLSSIRESLQEEIEALEIFGRNVFTVWINETADPAGGIWDSWEVCLEAAKNCDIMIALSNGNAGWAKEAGDVGICHAELMTAFSQAPAKVRLIQISNIPITRNAEGRRNQRFQDYVSKQSMFRGGTIRTVDDLKTRVKHAIFDALLSLGHLGVREASKGKFHSGEVLDWSHLDFKRRAEAMIKVLSDDLISRTDTTQINSNLYVKLSGLNVLVKLHAIPASFSVGPAREMVGQPFLRDHLDAPALEGSRGGPLHVIACQKGATEGQAINMLGFSDATVVTPPFGVFVADEVQKVQFAFIANCRDETTTRHGVQRFFEWLHQTNEDKLVAERSKSRARIVKVIAKEA